VVVVSFEARNYVVTTSIPLGLLVHVFDGIFLVHYVLDAWLWKFSDPYYRSTLTPLYLEPLTPAPMGARTRTRKPTPLVKLLGIPVLGLCVLGVLACYPRLSKPLYAALIAPLDAEQHLRWGIEFAQSGDLLRAQQQLARAVELVPQDARMRGLLAVVAQHIEEVQSTQPNLSANTRDE
jgi:hypothetical protein